MPVLYSEQMLNAAQNDFVVFVQARYWPRLEEIKAMVEKYKLVTKRAHYVKTGNPVDTNTAPVWTPNVFNRLIPK